MKTSKKTKAQLLEELEKLHCRNKELENLLAESEFYVASIAHDLKNPTIAIRGLADNLRRKYDNPDGPKAKIASQISKICESMEQLVADLNRFEHAKLAPLKIEDFDIQEVLEMLREEFIPRLKVRNVQLIEPRESFPVRASKLELRRALTNYISNALNYGGKDLSRIVIGCVEEPDKYTLSVYNDGDKISRRDCIRVFKEFVRCEKYRDIPGSGLGLAIVRKTAERHGGTAWAKPNKEGITFFISISKSL